MERQRAMETIHTGIWHNKPPESKEAAKNLLSLALEDKLTYTCANISDWDMFTNGNWYISFSGGKDSTVLLYIAAAMLNRIPVQPHPLRILFCDTGLEYPEIREFVPWYLGWLEEKFPRITIEYTRKRPEKNYLDVVREYGYPVISKEVSFDIEKARRGAISSLEKLDGVAKNKNTGKISKYNIPKYKYLINSPFKISSLCCGHTKKRPANLYEQKTRYLPMTAVMATEGKLRYKKWLQQGCNAYESKRPQSKPMSFWKEQDVLQFILQENIPVCSVYGETLPFDGENFYRESLLDMPLKCTGCRRTGCIFCAFGAHLEKGETRFQRLKRTHPKHWNHCINGGEWDPVDGMWKPSKTPGHIGMGMGRVLDFIGVKYE